MAKINVTPRSTRARYKHKGEIHFFGDVFEVDENDKNIKAAIKVRALRKVHDKKPAQKPDSVEDEKGTLFDEDLNTKVDDKESEEPDEKDIPEVDRKSSTTNKKK